MTEVYDKRNGSPFDRGGADSYYRRGINPHYFEGKANLSKEVKELTEAEIRAYMAGYEENERLCDFKTY